jgi:predicted dehydrogenase
MVAYMKRYDAGNVLLKETLAAKRASGAFGRLRYVRNQAIVGDWVAGLDSPVFGTDEPYPQTAEHWPSWLPESKRRGYFGYVQQYTHNVNFLRWLLDAGPGSVLPRAVELDPGDGISGVTLLDVNGTLACIESGSSRCHEWNERTSMFFDGGTIESNMFTLLLKNVPSTVEVYAGDAAGPSRTELFSGQGRTWAYKEEVLHFLDCLRDDKPFRSPAEDALEDVRVLEEIYRLHAEPILTRDVV